MKKKIIITSICGILLFAYGHEAFAQDPGQDNNYPMNGNTIVPNDTTQGKAGTNDSMQTVYPGLPVNRDTTRAQQAAAAMDPARPPEVIPPSPNAANLGKFVETPVSLYTGKPQTSIPIWTVESGALRLPISLDYSSGGIKVSEIASWVGLGWSLNAGGAVIRSGRGLPDEIGAGFLNVGPPQTGDYSRDIEYAQGSIDGEPDAFFYNFAGEGGKFVFATDGNIHTIPKKNIKIQKGPSRLFMTPIGPVSAVSSWIATTEDGVKYYFNNYEITSTISRTSHSHNVYDGNYGASNSVGSWYLSRIISPGQDTITFDYTEVSQQYDILSSITASYQMSGTCQSSSMVPYLTTLRQHVYAQRLTSIRFSTGKIRFVPCNKERADLIGDHALDKIIIENKKGEVLKQFTLQYAFMEGSTLRPYQDIPTTGENNLQSAPNQFPAPFYRRLLLTGMQEKDASGTPSNSGYSFEYHHDTGLPNRAYPHYDHWGFANQQEVPDPTFSLDIRVSYGNITIFGKNANPIYGKQGSLYRINYPTQGYTIFDLESNICVHPGMLVPNNDYTEDKTVVLSMSHHDYNGHDELYEMKPDVSTGQMQRHYYKQFTVSSKGGYVSAQAKTENLPDNAGSLGYYIVNMANPNARVWQQSNNRTDQIQLANGQYRLYHFPSQEILSNPQHPAINILYSATLKWTEIKETTGEYLVGGLRVGKITTYDPVTGQRLIKQYRYTLPDSDDPSGRLLMSPLYSTDYTEVWDKDGDNVYRECNYKLISTFSCYPLSTTLGSYVGYEYVEEKTIDISNSPMGRIIYQYLGPGDYPDLYPHGSSTAVLNELPYPPADERDWCRGLLKRQMEYAYRNGSFQKVREIENTYNPTIQVVSRGYKCGYGQRGTSPIYNIYARAHYNVSGGSMLLEKTEQREWLNSSLLETTTDYSYSQQNLKPVRIIQKASNNSKTHQYISYPSDYTQGTAFIDTMIFRNIIKPIEQVTAVEDAQGTKITEGALTKYRADKSGQPDNIQLLESGQSIAKNSFKFSSRSTGILPPDGANAVFSPDTRYKARITYDTYKNGRIATYTLNGVSYTILWGYHRQYPIAKIENVSFSEVVGKISGGETKLDEIAKKASPTDTEWNMINALRNSLPQALVTTYTYQPLVGMTSETDPSGRTIFYEYDAFGRLKCIKDENGKILKEHRYHYAGQ